MKKDRNTFFSEYGFNQASSFAPNNNMMMPNNTVSASNSFYAGPIPNQPMNNNMYSDIDSRISKLEREIHRLDTRISRLEGDSKTNFDDVNYQNSSMYMV